MSPRNVRIAHNEDNDDYDYDNAITLVPTQAGQPGNLQPHYQRVLMSKRNIANPSPLGLCGFALTTFILSAINMEVMDVTHANLIVGPAFAYGGLVQLCAGMWEMSIGNTFGATSLSSYGGFWIGMAIILTPGGFEIEAAYDSEEFNHAFSLYLFAWFIFTTIILLCTLSSSVAHCSIFFTLDLSLLCLALGRKYPHLDGLSYVPHHNLTYAGGVFGLLSAFAAWYNALAGIAASNKAFGHYPPGTALPVV
ncbi:Monocarboxylate transporter acpA [Hyphodiscus hymeniophilus]|uniref:Monocarboxylate transporter acpA n=1 Tax=Hyphodiscus hymeniophilus TaxID=353542 RepID=A0A9P6VE42_9HELO|nr:Monocarboxylate transporter acpA [Hyphodiscus hymeniophilus]